jgi:hypothetical protein
MVTKLVVPYGSREAFERDFHDHIEHGALFVPTFDVLEPRDRVRVVLDLQFCGSSVALEAEVVSSVGSDVDTGVSVQFMVPIDEIRRRVSESSGVESDAAAIPTENLGDSPRHPRTKGSVVTEITAGARILTTHTRNLSRSGALLAVDGGSLPVGSEVEVTLIHPRTGEPLAVHGSVVRHDRREGHPPGIAIQFGSNPEADDDMNRGLEDIRSAAHASNLGGFSGTIAGLALANLLQMLSSCGDHGTLELTGTDALEARLLFQHGGLRHAEFGRATGIKAVSRILLWGDGGFQFQPSVAAGEPADAPLPMDRVLTEALREVEELRRLDRSNLPDDAIVEAVATADDDEALAESLIELSVNGVRVLDLLDAMPHRDSELLRAILDLLDRKLMRLSES